MRRRRSVFASCNVKHAGREVNLVPAQRRDLRSTKPVPVSHHDQQRITLSHTAASLPRGNYQALDFIRRQMFTRSDRIILLPRWRCS